MSLRCSIAAPVIVALAFTASCVTTPEPAPPAASGRPSIAPREPRDPDSASNPESVRVTHAAFDFTVGFSPRTVSGRVTWTLQRIDPTAPLRLDVKNLALGDVKAGSATGLRTVSSKRTKVDDLHGDVLEIPLAPGDDRVEIAFTADEKSGALVWMTPEQTAGKKSPYVFSASQPIEARALFPCQDSPAVRFTYTATIHTPGGLTAVMAAESQGQAGGAYRFRMEQPIPSYLVAFAVGDIGFRALSPRTGVYTEPAMLDAAAWEFTDTEKMLASVEKLYGPYSWGRYDILVLPPSFPAGGMENPRLTFVSPTLLAGDRSLVATIAHEIAHSWSGNLVTNANWRHLWMNEGFTVYLEGRITEAVFGRERYEMETALEVEGLKGELKDLPVRAQSLHVSGTAPFDPNEAFSGVAYAKGGSFLRRLELAFGRETFDPVLRAWFEKNAWKSATTQDFVAYLETSLFPKNPAAAAQLNVAEWIAGAGIPADFPHVTSAAFSRIDALAADVKNGTKTAADVDGSRYTTQEWVRFVRAFGDRMDVSKMAELDARFHFRESKNAEIASPWLTLATKSGYAAANPDVARFLASVGRAKFLRPIYVALAATEEGRSRGKSILENARSGYHLLVAEEMEKIVTGVKKS
ncbi:MAG: M1 family metallopeptidase [Acidobacteria bacterium]|nr:M1 family metallopeptidase [Acidobacteriota bacterium]